MSHRRAKKIRSILLPKGKVTEAGAKSRGDFIRATTNHKNIETGAVRMYPWPLDVLFGKIPVPCIQTVLGECPKRSVQQVKRNHNRRIRYEN